MYCQLKRFNMHTRCMHPHRTKCIISFLYADMRQRALQRHHMSFSLAINYNSFEVRLNVTFRLLKILEKLYYEFIFSNMKPDGIVFNEHKTKKL